MKDDNLFKIDLLKGQALPEKFGFESVIATVVIILLPLIIGSSMLSWYLKTNVNIVVQQQEIRSYEKRIEKLAGSVGTQKAFENDKSNISGSIKEVSKTLGRYTQWTPILIAMVSNMPESVMLTQLNVDHRSIKRKVPQKGNPEKMVEMTIPVKVLNMSIAGRNRDDCDQKIKDFRASLRKSPLLGPMIEYITVSQGFDKLDNQDVISYEVDCVLKPVLN